MIVRILHDGQYRIGDADVAAIQTEPQSPGLDGL